jgi:hypothetical protein
VLYPVQLRDLTGREYPHFVQGMSVRWYRFPGNYAFARLVPEIGGGGSCIILYLGEAEDMSTHMPHHERLHEALVDHGATHALYHPNFGGVDARRAVERNLIAFYKPVMNAQHRTSALITIADWAPRQWHAFNQMYAERSHSRTLPHD